MTAFFHPRIRIRAAVKDPGPEALLLTSSQAAARLGVSSTTFNGIVREGRIRPVFVRARRLYHRDAVRAFADSLLQQSSAVTGNR